MWRDHTKRHRKSSGGGNPRHQRQHKQPDHFIAFQISNPKILQEMENVQQSMVAINGSLLDAMTSIQKSHITLMVTNLSSYLRKQRAKDALDLSATRLRSVFRNNPIEIDIEGMGSFGERVIFANPHGKTDDPDKDVLKHIHDIVQDSYGEYGIYTTDTRSAYNPHLTLAKTSKVLGHVTLPASLYEENIDHIFGTEFVTTIQLCEMEESEGYYNILHQVQFVSGPKST